MAGRGRRLVTETGRRGAAVALMTRAPRPGEGKSRLAAAVGEEAAARLAGAFLLDAAAAVTGGGDWHPTLFVEPADAVPELAALTGIEDARPQASGDIGLRMLAVAAELERERYAPIVIVDSDVPTLAPHHPRDALGVLRRRDVVFGPAEDGGYYLVAMWRAQPALFTDAGIEWGGSEVLLRLERVARLAGLSSGRIAPERDIDTAADLERLRERIALLERRGEAVPRHMAAALAELADDR